MKIKYIKPLPGHHVGKVLTVRPCEAALLIRLGFAEEFSKPIESQLDDSLKSDDKDKSPPKPKRGRKKKAE